MFQRKWISKQVAKNFWPYKHNQPERSKREDTYIPLNDSLDSEEKIQQFEDCWLGDAVL